MVQKFQNSVGQFTPIKWNVSHNLLQMKAIVNYRNCILLVLVVFSSQCKESSPTTWNSIPTVGCHQFLQALHPLLKKVSLNGKKLSSRTIGKGMSKGTSIFFWTTAIYKLYLIWTQISQCWFPNNFEFIHSNLLKFCICSKIKIMKFVIS